MSDWHCVYWARLISSEWSVYPFGFTSPCARPGDGVTSTMSPDRGAGARGAGGASGPRGLPQLLTFRKVTVRRRRLNQQLLFTNMTFNLRRHCKDKKDIYYYETLIKHCGGKVDESNEFCANSHIIYLGLGEAPAHEEVFSAKFLGDCDDKQAVQDLKDYRINIKSLYIPEFNPADILDRKSTWQQMAVLISHSIEHPAASNKSSGNC